MSEEFGSDFITIIDDDGTEFELEVLDTMDYKDQTFVAFLPANMDENDPDYGIIILRSVLDENGDELFESIDDDDELMYKPISWVDSLKYIPKKYHKKLLENSSQVEKECYEASRFSLKGAAT